MHVVRTCVYVRVRYLFAMAINEHITMNILGPFIENGVDWRVTIHFALRIYANGTHIKCKDFARDVQEKKK